MKKIPLPKIAAWMLLNGLTILLLLALFRAIFFFHFRSSEMSFSDYSDAFKLGVAFDIRVVCMIILLPFLFGIVNLKSTRQKNKLGLIIQIGIVLLIMAFFSVIIKRIVIHLTTLQYLTLILFFVLILFGIFRLKNCSPFENLSSKKIFKLYFLITIFLLVLIYAVDFQNYDYLHHRLSSSIFNYSKDLKTSMAMVWETYPVILMLLIIITTTLLAYLTLNYYYNKINKSNYNGSQPFKILILVSFGFCLGLGIFGRLNIFPLRLSNALKWSDAFYFQNDFKGNLSLNPVQSLLSSLGNKSATYDIREIKKFYRLVASDLGVEDLDSINLNYSRQFHPAKKFHSPNIILVICESFAGYKSSMWGNPLNTTPFFNKLCQEGVFFDRCFSPGFWTTRGIWSIITGIPDVEYPKMASQNPAYTDQSSIINSYTDYKKFYFVGGNSGFENVGALLNNIKGLEIYEEKDFKSKRINVWGISDKRLFMEANKVLEKQTSPFFAIIQTSQNHRPYTIAQEDLGEFKLQELPVDTLKKYGFESNDELNSFRYSDFGFEKLIEIAKKATYFKNTIFVFIGDHGNPGIPPPNFPSSYNLGGLTFSHVPLLFYSPAFLKPKRISSTASQLDVLPSVSALAGISYTNNTLGRNLFDTASIPANFENARFLYNAAQNSIGMITDQYVYKFNLDTKKEIFLSSRDDSPVPNTSAIKHIRRELQVMARAYFETAKYMLANNKKRTGVLIK